MPVTLLRVDERLIHGQVVIGWGSTLHPHRYVVVDDEVAASPWERELYELGLPEGAIAEFLTVDEARQNWRTMEEGEQRTVVLVRNLNSLMALADNGTLRGQAVNLGGLHSGPGRERVLPYVYLDLEDRERLVHLLEGGIEVSARDLPGAPRVDARTLLDR